MTGCGKTFFLLELLETEYKKHFENIFVVCPTFAHNRTYREWKYVTDECFFAITCDHDEVERYLREVTSYAKETNSLIVLDDCASSQAVKNRTSELIKLGFSARHYGLSTIVLTQQLTSIAKPYRENISKLVTFYSPSTKDLNTIFDDYLSTLDASEKKQIIYRLKNNDFARLEVLLRRPYSHEVVVPKINEQKGLRHNQIPDRSAREGGSGDLPHRSDSEV